MWAIRYFKQKWDATIDLDVCKGILRIYCTALSYPKFDPLLQTEIECAKQLLREETWEELMGQTRLVLHSGYVVTSILFAGEYDSVVIYSVN